MTPYFGFSRIFGVDLDFSQTCTNLYSFESFLIQLCRIQKSEYSIEAIFLPITYWLGLVLNLHHIILWGFVRMF